MLFAYDIVLIDETKYEVNIKLKVWREALESKGFRISRTKTEYIKYNFNKSRNTNEETVKIISQDVPKRKKIRYLGSIIQKDCAVDNDVNNRI